LFNGAVNVREAKTTAATGGVRCQSEAGNPEKLKVPQWKVLAANRAAGWEAGRKKVEVDERNDS
jgi:hypothetical protein